MTVHTCKLWDPCWALSSLSPPLLCAAGVRGLPLPLAFLSCLSRGLGVMRCLCCMHTAPFPCKAWIILSAPVPGQSPQRGELGPTVPACWRCPVPCTSQQLGTRGWAEECPFFSPLLLLSLQPLYSPPCPKLSLEPESATCARRPGPICSCCLMNSQLLGGGIVTEVIQSRHYTSIYFPILLVKMFDEPPSLLKHLLSACWVELSRKLNVQEMVWWEQG